MRPKTERQAQAKLDGYKFKPTPALINEQKEQAITEVLAKHNLLHTSKGFRGGLPLERQIRAAMRRFGNLSIDHIKNT